MYLDYILFIIAASFTAVAVIAALYLLFSRKKSKAYTAVLNEEKEVFDALKSTSAGSRAAATSVLVSGSYGGSGSTEPIYGAANAARSGGFDVSALEGRYIIDRELSGGGMSRVFLGRSAKLGNQWIIKYIPSQKGYAPNEDKILKQLNHPSLPQIIDVFRKEAGGGDDLYIVESFIEGVSLDNIRASNVKLSYAVLTDWFEQIAQSLNYLHNIKQSPIYHLDLKPSNVMATHDNRLIVIDFGISRQSGDAEYKPSGVTYQYAAPEQIKHKISERRLKIVADRFGELPGERFSWRPDARSDIFSLGVIMFELAVGSLPTTSNRGLLSRAVSQELCAIINKCMEINPQDRYQSAERLLSDLRALKLSKGKMAGVLYKRRLAVSAAAASLFLSAGAFGGGYYVYAAESASAISARPASAVVSLRQSAEFTVEKETADGKIITLNGSDIRWDSAKDNIARVSGGKVTGLNPGATTITGKYRDKTVELIVRVVEPVEGLVDVSQLYEPGREVKLFAGGDSSFVSPESIDADDNGAVFITDAGAARVIENGEVSTLDLFPDYITAGKIRVYGDTVCILTNPWQDDEGYKYAFALYENSELNRFYTAEAEYSAIEDFAFGEGGVIYFIDRNAGLGKVFLKTADPGGGGITTLCELPAGTSALAVSFGGKSPSSAIIYLSNADSGVIYVFSEQTSKLEYFAGIEEERAFIDGESPRFYYPQRLKFYKDYLYVWDYNTLRRIEANGGVAGECITIAGMASPDFELAMTETRMAADDCILPHGMMMDIAITGGKILLTDHKRGVIWSIAN